MILLVIYWNFKDSNFVDRYKFTAADYRKIYKFQKNILYPEQTMLGKIECPLKVVTIIKSQYFIK